MKILMVAQLRETHIYVANKGKAYQQLIKVITNMHKGVEEEG